MGGVENSREEGGRRWPRGLTDRPSRCAQEKPGRPRLFNLAGVETGESPLGHLCFRQLPPKPAPPFQKDGGIFW